MKFLVISIILFLIFGCYSIKNIHKETFNFNDNGRNHKLVINIPKCYSFERIKANAEYGREERYWYKDSSVIYISDLKSGSTLNYSNIRGQKNAYAKRFEFDTITLSGINKFGKYWKEIKYNQLFYGYSNIPANEKKLFDHALSSGKIK